MNDDRPPQFPASSFAALLGGVSGAVGCGTAIAAGGVAAGYHRPGWGGVWGMIFASAGLAVLVAVPGAVAGMFGAGFARRYRRRVRADWPPTLTDFAGALLAGSALTASLFIALLWAARR